MAYYPAVRRSSFWFDSSRPRDAPDGNYVFIGTAVDILGRAIFADWQEDTPRKAFASVGKDKNAIDRISQIMDELGPAIARGQVKFALRAAKGGDFKLPREELGVREGAFIQFSRSSWNVDDFTPLFKFGQMSDGIFRSDYSVPDWIYVERESLHQFITSNAKHNPPAVVGEQCDENSVMGLADQIISIKKENSAKTKDQIENDLKSLGGITKAAFGSAWTLAREKYPLLMKAGAPKKPKKTL
ncbi:hypothetical protein J2S28_000036 [Rhizobium sp. SLBN-94]|nr:hypothetical protein [Rhizobium sp. SLBN-94]